MATRAADSQHQLPLSLKPVPGDEGGNADVVNASLTIPSAWEQNTDKRALDELFSLTRQYRDSEAYRDLLKFVVQFESYSPYNAMLIHVQMPGAAFVSPPHRWLKKYQRTIKPGARPIVILQPMGPVMFVFDVSDTEPADSASPVPLDIQNPFKVTEGAIGSGLCRVIENVKRDGVRVTFSEQQGSHSAGSIRHVRGVKVSQKFRTGRDPRGNIVMVDIPVNYDLEISAKLSDEERYATIAHELSHLYCGHLGSLNPRWWPSRVGLSDVQSEFEAESAAYLVCGRFGIANPSHRYLASYYGRNDQVPPISLDRVMATAGLIEAMTKRRLKPRD